MGSLFVKITEYVLEEEKQKLFVDFQCHDGVESFLEKSVGFMWVSLTYRDVVIVGKDTLREWEFHKVLSVQFAAFSYLNPEIVLTE